MAHSCERQPVFCLDIKKKGGSQSMSLQFIFGNSGSGKSHYLYQQIVEESIRHPEKNYLVLVPEQFTMQTQKDLCMAHPRGGIMNIDVLSFGRLAHRVFEETGKERQPILDDEGKNLVLRKIAGNYEDELTVLKGNLKKQGYISEVKSVISEFTQYGIDFEQLDSFMEGLNPESYLYYKLKDIRKVYEGFEDYLRDKYITKEELLDVLSQTVPEAKMLKDSVIAMDGFTGFTPVQNRLIGELLKVCDKIMLTVEMDRREDPFVYKHPYQLFALSKQMVTSLTEVAQEVKVEIDELAMQESAVSVQRESGDGVFGRGTIPLFQKKIQWGKDAVNLSSRSSHTTGRGTVCGRGNPASGERRRIQISGNRSDCF